LDGGKEEMMRRSCRIAIGGILWFYTFHPAHLGAEEGDAGAPQSEMSTRKQLEERGVTLGSAYVSEVFTNWKGGFDPRRSASYLGSLNASISVDLARAQLGRGRFFVSAQTLHGHSINDTRVGAVQAMSNLDEHGFGKFVEAWYADAYFGGRLQLKAGRQYADADFGLVAIGSSFLNSSYGVMPTTPMPTYPEPAWGASLWITPLRHISFGAGVFRGGFLENPSKGTLPVKKQPFTIFETKLEPFSKHSSQQGTYRFGIWQQARSAWLNRDCAAPVRNHGFYAAADHWFLKSDSEDHRGPGIFGQWGWTPSNRNEIAGYAGGGFTYQGVTMRRSRDAVGFGATRVRLASAHTELVYELFYKCRLGAQVTIEPDLQWVRRAGGAGRNAVVGGLRLVIEL